MPQIEPLPYMRTPNATTVRSGRVTWRRFNWRRAALSLACTALAWGAYSAVRQPIRPPRNTLQGAGVRLTLLTEYKDNILQQISSDGRLAVFYQSSLPTRGRSFEGRRPGADQANVYDHVLRVVELESGYEVARVSTGFSTFHVQLLPGTEQVFYSEPDAGHNSRFKVWDFRSGKVQACPEGNAIALGDAMLFRPVVALDREHALALHFKKEGPPGSWWPMYRLDLNSCTAQLLDPALTQHLAGTQLVLSPDQRQVAYRSVDGREVVIRDTSAMRLIRRLAVAGLFLGHRLYTPDGKFLLVVASDTENDRAETKRYLLFYETQNYDLVRKLDVTQWKAVAPMPHWKDAELIPDTAAISPDGKMIAMSYKEEGRDFLRLPYERAVIMLYDLESGAEMGQASYPAMRPQHGDHFQAEINHLAFTPDGKYIISSIHDTRVWRIDTKASR